MTLLTPALYAFIILSEKGKKASDAITEPNKKFFLFFLFALVDFKIAKSTESILLVLPEPIPKVTLFFAITIALDLTCFTILFANIRSSSSTFFGFFNETTFKSFFLILASSLS